VWASRGDADTADHGRQARGGATPRASPARIRWPEGRGLHSPGQGGTM